MNKKIRTDKLLYADITYKVRGAIFAVYNELGFGHKEQVYQKALAEEFDSVDISYKREKSLDVKYKNSVVGNYKPDFVIEDKIVMEIKAVEFMPKSYEIQLINYLKTTEFHLGLLVNFGSPRLYIKRLIFSHPRKSVVDQRKSLV